MNKKKLIFTATTINLITIVTVALCRTYPERVEQYYSRGVFPFITRFMGSWTDLIPFSVSEVLLVLLILSFLLFTGYTLYQIIAKKSKAGKYIVNYLLYLYFPASLILFFFYFNWGLNYYRVPIIKSANEEFDPSGFTDEDFNRALYFFRDQVNRLYTPPLAPRDEITKKVNSCVLNAIQDLTGESLYPARRVKYFLTHILAATNTLGVVSPFLLESHLSQEILESEYPFTTAHEKAHLYGIAHETEANFIAFYACVLSDDPYIQYSACQEILAYFLSSYRQQVTPEKYKQFYLTLREEVQLEWEKKRARYQKHDSRLNQRFWDLYDLYLKANKVDSGNKSYSQVVQMLLKSRLLSDLLDKNDNISQN